MEIIILMSVVPDTSVKIKLTADGLPDMKEIPWIINPWDELALTRALELKEDPGNTVNKVTLLHVGPSTHGQVLRKAMAMGADEAVRIEATPRDSYETAYHIVAFLQERAFDLVLAGIESSDYNGAAVGGLVAGMLDIPSVSAVTGIQTEGDKLHVVRETDGGRETLRMPLPLLAVVQKGIAKEPRMPSMRGLMMARKKTIHVIEPGAVDSLTEYARFELPPPKPPCHMVDATNPGELLELLENESKVIHLS